MCLDLIRYFQTDTICFHESEPEALVRQQTTHWDPLLAWAEARWGIAIERYRGILLSSSQPAASVQTLLQHVQGTYGALELAAFERAVLTTKSFIIALALLEGKLDVEAAALAAEVEVNSQTERWGQVEDTHDVDYSDVRRLLGSVAAVLVKEKDAEVVKACL